MMTPVPAAADARWDSFVDLVRGECAGFFDAAAPITAARAPGRLDVLGGVCDYSGGTVLEATIAEATCAAVQARPDRLLRLRSLGAAQAGLREDVNLPLDRLLPGGLPISFEEARSLLNVDPAGRWAAYVAGCLYVLFASGWLEPEQASGMNILVRGDVPIGVGVSSSASLEVAVMSALCAHFGLQMDGLELAQLCQTAENRVAGAPCGIMDQVAVTLGHAGSLLVLRCRPHDVLGHQTIPPGWRFAGIDSHTPHAVNGFHYTRARVAAFMALKIMQVEGKSDWDGYLCAVSPDIWRPWRERLPEEIGGAEFLERYGALPDPVTAVDPARTYRVRAAAEHHILENNRVREFLVLTQFADEHLDEQLLREAGQLMLAAHASYSERLDLGSPGTDLLVDLAMEEGPDQGIFGAKITGGGSGGTVAVLCAGPRADAAIARVLAEYERRTGIFPRLMVGSSPGAMDFGAHTID